MSISRKDFLRNSMLATGMAVSGFSLKQKDETFKADHQMIKPKALKIGDTLGLVAPASPIYEQSVFDEMLVNLSDLGFKLKLGRSVRKQRGYLAGADSDRLEDLMAMFSDEEVNGILCIRGGWGSNRILPDIDYELIRNNPKVFCGFSDITSLHLAIQKHAGLYTFHGPVGKSVWNDFTTKAFQSILMEPELTEQTIPEEEQKQAFVVQPGKASGKMLGGNLSVLTTLIGTEYLPDMKGAILFLEDVGESVYRIDRMLTHLKMAGLLDGLNGFIFGKCTECSAGPNSLELKDVFNDHIKPLGIPAFYGAMISHEDHNLTIPVGVEAEMNAKNLSFRFKEYTVKF